MNESRLMQIVEQLNKTKMDMVQQELYYQIQNRIDDMKIMVEQRNLLERLLKQLCQMHP